MNNFTQFDINRLTELEKLGYYDKNKNVFTLLQFIKLDRWQFDKQTKKKQFKDIMQQIEFDINKYEKKTPKIIIREDIFKTLTKTYKALIKELINDKLIIKEDNYYTFNQVIVYCNICTKHNMESDYIKNENRKAQELREFDIKRHLEVFHYYYKTSYSRDYKKEYRTSTVTDEIIKANISYSKPEYRFKDHIFVLVELSSNKDDLIIKVKCKDCGYEPYIRTERLSKMCEANNQ